MGKGLVRSDLENNTPKEDDQAGTDVHDVGTKALADPGQIVPTHRCVAQTGT